MARKMKYLPDHPLAGRTGYISRARAVLYEKIGPGKHSCHWCDAPIEWMKGKRGGMKGAVIADHVDRDIMNDAPDNLVASCHTCNATRNREDLIESDEHWIVNGDHRTRAEKRTCHTCGAEFLYCPSKAGRGPRRGLYCSRECMYKRGTSH